MMFWLRLAIGINWLIVFKKTKQVREKKKSKLQSIHIKCMNGADFYETNFKLYRNRNNDIVQQVTNFKYFI